jgi:hypothetical protein
MKKLYLGLAILGFILPNYFVLLESIETGNVLLYGNIMDTMNGMFANRISTIFTIDLLFAVMVFFIWSYVESKRKGIKNIAVVWVITMLFGFACGLPLFLYRRAQKS